MSNSCNKQWPYFARGAGLSFTVIKGSVTAPVLGSSYVGPFWIPVVDLVPVFCLSPVLNPVSRIQADSSLCKSQGQSEHGNFAK